MALVKEGNLFFRKSGRQSALVVPTYSQIVNGETEVNRGDMRAFLDLEDITLSSKYLPQYQERIKLFNERARKSLDIFPDKNGILVGSNCFAPLVLREFLPKNSKLATMYDLEKLGGENPEIFKGFYIDTGLFLRTPGDSYKPNDLPAKNLAEQLKHRSINLETPKVIYFDALNLDENQDSAYGLTYRLNERAEFGKNIIDAPELTSDSMFKTIDERGIPVQDSKGNRQLYTRRDGLSRFSLYWYRYSNVNSYDRDLADSYDNGQVVVLDAEGVALKNALNRYSARRK